MHKYEVMTRIKMFLFALLVLISLNASGQLVYTNGFISAAGSEWSPRNTSVTPVGARRFLGEFGNGTVVLTLTNLLPHAEVSVALDLFIIRTWDGIADTDKSGEDIWSLSVSGGPTLLQTSFLNSFLINKNSAQSFPDDVGSVLHDGRMGTVENNTLGYAWNGRPLDSVYHLTFTFPHAASSLAWISHR